MFQSWSSCSTDQTKQMFLNIVLLILLLLQVSPSTSSVCSEDELDVLESFEWFTFGISDCDKEEFIIKMKNYFLEKATNLKQCIFLAKKLLDNAHSKSVFYFFCPFQVHFCSVQHLQWFHKFYEECLHGQSPRWSS